MNVYEVRLDGVTKKVTADYYQLGDNGVSYLRFWRIINDPNSEEKAKLVAEFRHYDYVTLESENAMAPIGRIRPWTAQADDRVVPDVTFDLALQQYQQDYPILGGPVAPREYLKRADTSES